MHDRTNRRSLLFIVAGTSLLFTGVMTAAGDIIPAPKQPGAATDVSTRAQIRALDAQIKSATEQYHASADPLQQQVKALHDSYENQVKSLKDQKIALESPDRRALDQDEAAQLDNLSKSETAEIDAIRSKYSDQRKSLQQSFAQKRTALKPSK